MPRREEWTLKHFGPPPDVDGASPADDFVRIKKWSAMVDGEGFQESTYRAAMTVVPILQYPNNQPAASEMLAELHGGGGNGGMCTQLGREAWDALRRAFETGFFVIVKLKPFKDWTSVPPRDRQAYVMKAFVETFKYPLNSAAGVVGNLYAESGLLPDRIESSSPSKPMRALNWEAHPKFQDYSPEEIAHRDKSHHYGPMMPGIGLAQWTAGARRRGLFNRVEGGHALKQSILFDLDAQITPPRSSERAITGSTRN